MAAPFPLQVLTQYFLMTSTSFLFLPHRPEPLRMQKEIVAACLYKMLDHDLICREREEKGMAWLQHARHILADQHKLPTKC